ncbi:MAG: Ig-like domain-containing protein [Gemmatimonadota bacterium]|nr:Ig-like domain-containing protein [Gemmatimonadota bacterium]
MLRTTAFGPYSCAAGLMLSACGGAPETTTAVSTLSTVNVVVAPSAIQINQHAFAIASGVDQNGKAIALDQNITWSSASPSIASVNAYGLVTGLAPGQSSISATFGGKVGSATIVVKTVDAVVGDFAVFAQFTQGVQSADGSIPMVLSGNAAAVNVLVRASTPPPAPMQVVLRILDAAGTLIRSDTAITSGVYGPTPSYSAPNAQFLVPASILKVGLTWQVVRDPKGDIPDDSVGTDVFPRTGTAPLAVVDVPPLNVRFVPITLAANGGATGAVNAGNLSQYLRTLKSVHPLGVINAHVGPGIVTNANFGTAPSGGAAAFWQQVLGELDLARIADPIEPDANWYGVVVPPTGFNNTAYGGFSYIPLNSANTGAGTRTSVAVQVNWFFNPTQARDLVAHEIGHTFGRMHAPCGAAGAPLDASFPKADGTLEQAGHDVFAWASGIAASAATIPATTGDVMGYCNPAWASAYTYRAVMAFRGATVLASRAPDPVTRVLIVRGTVSNGNQIALEPAFTLDARPTPPAESADYRMEALDDRGQVLVSVPFTPFVLDHAPDVRPFTIAVPSTTALETQVASIVVRGPAGVRRLDRAPQRGAVSMTATVVRTPDGALTARCADASARGIVLLRANGSVLGSAAAASLRMNADAGTSIAVVCSDGVRSTRSRIIAQ